MVMTERPAQSPVSTSSLNDESAPGKTRTTTHMHVTHEYGVIVVHRTNRLELRRRHARSAPLVLRALLVMRRGRVLQLTYDR